jgi:hypothetical protein
MPVNCPKGISGLCDGCIDYSWFPPRKESCAFYKPYHYIPMRDLLTAHERIDWMQAHQQEKQVVVKETLKVQPVSKKYVYE